MLRELKAEHPEVFDSYDELVGESAEGMMRAAEVFFQRQMLYEKLLHEFEQFSS